MKANPKFIISGGGTGGHIFPAIAIANEIKRQLPDAEFLFVGAKDKMEMQKVPTAGFAIEGLWISGIQRKLTLSNALFPLKLVSSMWRARQIIKNFNPDAVIGTGGFASGPILKVAGEMGIPTFIQEQNSFPGITNKWLANSVKKIFVAYDGLEKYFPADKLILSGNPVRDNLNNVSALKSLAQTKYQLKPEQKTLVILGGSLGSGKINEFIASKIAFFQANNIQLLWQCGKNYYEKYKNLAVGNQIQVFDFVEDMNMLYAAADVILSRAGASSVSELCLVGKPVIFVPSPNVAEDHQTKNAMQISQKNAAVLLKESELEAKFEAEFLRIIQNEQVANGLSQNIQKLAKAHSAEMIVNEILKYIK